MYNYAKKYYPVIKGSLEKNIAEVKVKRYDPETK